MVKTGLFEWGCCCCCCRCFLSERRWDSRVTASATRVQHLQAWLYRTAALDSLNWDTWAIVIASWSGPATDTFTLIKLFFVCQGFWFFFLVLHVKKATQKCKKMLLLFNNRKARGFESRVAGVCNPENNCCLVFVWPLCLLEKLNDNKESVSGFVKSIFHTRKPVVNQAVSVLHISDGWLKIYKHSASFLSLDGGTNQSTKIITLE